MSLGDHRFWAIAGSILVAVFLVGLWASIAVDRALSRPDGCIKLTAQECTVLLRGE